jgi:hypothetical protein
MMIHGLTNPKAIPSLNGFIRKAFVMEDDYVLCKVENKISGWFERIFKPLKI